MSLIASGSTYAEAAARARADILKIFFLEKGDMTDSQNLDITKVGDDNAILLAMSLILQGYQSTSKLSKLISEISIDIKDDGILDNANLKSQLKINGLLLDYSKIRQNLTQFYTDNSIQVSVPDFETFVDQFNKTNDYPLISTLEFPHTNPQLRPGANLLEDGIIYTVQHKEGNDVLSIKIDHSKVKIIVTPIFDGNFDFVGNMDVVKDGGKFILSAESWAGETLFSNYYTLDMSNYPVEGVEMFRIELFEYKPSLADWILVKDKVLTFHGATACDVYGGDYCLQ